jgi:hypothetical protein
MKQNNSWIGVTIGTALTLVVIYFGFRVASAGWHAAE